ncbi:MAG: L-rhamnose/proton symporter RhaT [Candidatus Hydrogenedentes bacterium]|nr:L-rhamnose/proton symporter RhaT [Candidatus Hydrogenedentota bacterium]
MAPNPFLGVILHAIGGLASASFYIPYRRVRHWAWESYWLAGGFFSWIIAPWVLALLIVPDVPQILAQTPLSVLFWAYFFGAMWGLGGLTFGLTMRYLGIALGMAIALGYCAAFGTLMPPIFDGKFASIVGETSGQVTLLGVAVCLAGIAVSGLAGMSKEKELPEEQKKAAIKEFNFFKGILVATFSGVMSASMSYGLAAGKPIAELALQHNAPPLFQNLPVLIVVLAGGFTTNFIWCVLLNVKNKSARDYIAPVSASDGVRVPLLSNYVFSAIAGTTWYLQFFFYSMGTTKMGKYDFSSWTLHMSSIIIFSTLWGIALREWKGTSPRTHVLIAIGLAVLIGSTVVVGYGNYLGNLAGH